MTYLELNFIYLAIFTTAYCLLQSNQRKKDIVCLYATFGSVLLFNIIKDWKHMDDIALYVPTFEYICRQNSNFDTARSYYKMQIGYYWLNKIIGYVSSSRYWFMFAIGCITALPYAMLIKKYSPWVWLSCLLYFMVFCQSTYVLRQHSAIGMTILTLPLLLRLPSDSIRRALKGWKNIRLCIMILCLYAFAILLHPTAIIFSFVFFAYFMKNIKWFVAVTFLGGLILYFMLPILTFVFVDNTAGYDVYMEAENGNKGGTIIINGIYLMASLYALRPYDKLSQLWKLLFKVQCIIFAFSIISMAPGGGAGIPRLLLYLTCFNCILLPYIAKRMPDKIMRTGFVTGILFIAYYVFVLSSNVHSFNMNIDGSLF